MNSTGSSQSRAQLSDFVEGPLVDRAVAEEAGGDPVLVPVLGGKGQPDGDRELAADNGIAPHEVEVRVEEVHGAPLPLADAGRLAEQLRHHPPRLGAADDGLGMLPVGGEDVVVPVQRRGGADRHRLLAAVEVEKTGDVPLGVLLGARLLEFAAEHHLLVQLQQFMVGQDRPEF